MSKSLSRENLIRDFIEEHIDAKIPFLNWLEIFSWAKWKEPEDILSTFNSANILVSHDGLISNRVVFEIKNSNGIVRYIMICQYNFEIEKITLIVKWVGTYTEYEIICLLNKQYKV